MFLAWHSFYESLTDYTLWISRGIATTGVSECSQQRSNLKDDGYRCHPHKFHDNE
ncbi:hypothetical protein [Photorhabdus laumondii]|uniref:hypothetical protein n=1 Tax=Photorhabdus laumondii TaxID=2218628 RepID=UPI0033161F6E